MRFGWIGPAAIAALLVAASPGWACQGRGAPLLAEDFHNPDIGWGKPDATAYYTPEGLVLRPPPDQSAWRWNQNFAMARADLCVEVTNPSPLPAPANAATVGDVGTWFWGKDSQNFFTATISLDGTAAVDRLVNGIWQAIVPPTRSSAVRTAPGAVNEVEVVVNGNAGALYVNGSRIAEFRGQAPPGGGPPGVYGESGPNGTTWLFKRVTLY